MSFAGSPCDCGSCSECDRRDRDRSNSSPFLEEEADEYKARAEKAEAELKALRSATFSVLGWFHGSQCNDCTPKGKYGAGGWDGDETEGRIDGHEADCGYALAYQKVDALLAPWQAEAYARNQQEKKQ
jgi:hypothetical protein